MRKKRLTKIIVIVLLIYSGLLILLIAAENAGASNGQGIRSFGEALWYLIATLTTVGYGDVTPATGIGKFIGAMMMVSSAGVLTFLLGLMFSLLFGRLLPRFRLWSYRKRKWYIFTDLEERSQLLARELAAKDPDAAYIFIGDNNKHLSDIIPELSHIIIVDIPPESVLAFHGPYRGNSVFYMNRDGFDNYDRAWALQKKSRDWDLQIFCETEHTPGHLPPNMMVFSRTDITARSFWLHYPLQKNEHVIVLVGEDKLTRNMLERALLINVFFSDHPVEYHVFGDWDNFRRDHYMLSQAVSINEIRDGFDSIFFHSSPWNESATLLQRASRIIFCSDDEEVNLLNMAELYRYFPVRGNVYVCAKAHETNSAVFFGSDDLIFSRENIISNKLNRLAIQLNELYCQKTGIGSKWEELSEFHRQSNIAAADHLLIKARLLLDYDHPPVMDSLIFDLAYKKYCTCSEEKKEACRRLEHKRWMRFHFLNNWQYASERDNSMRHHNLLIPYEELSSAEQSKDDSAWEILGSVKI